MNIQKPEDLLSVVLPGDIPPSPSSLQLLNQDQQDEEASDCPLLTPSPPPGQMFNNLEGPAMFNPLETNPMFPSLEGTPLEMTPPPSLENIITEDVLNGYMNMVTLNSSSKPLNDEPSSRDPMVESSSSSSSSGDNEPVCTQLLTQLNTAYQHLAPDAQALFYNQENGGKPPLVGIQLVVPKTPKDYRFMAWNWPFIRKACFWSFMSVLAGCAALVIGVIATMPKRCDPPVEWWQGSLFYEIFPASFQNSSNGDGIGDLRGITMRLDYLKTLSVKGIRLNSVFPAPHYPEHYSNITSLTAINPTLGTLEDFNLLALEVHRKNMTLILDLPLYPFVKNFNQGNTHFSKPNKTDEAVRERRDTETSVLPNITPTPEPTSFQSIRNILRSIPPPAELRAEAIVASSSIEPKEDNVVTAAIKFWLQKGVDGFYLKGLERYVKEKNFVDMLRHWKSIVGPNRILICDVDALNNAPSDPVRHTILNRIDLIDVTLNFSEGTAGIKSQVDGVTKGILYEKTGYPWVHWSIGGVDTKRIASVLNVKNASIAASLLGMMLPGTPSIFYGDEVGMVDCDCKDHHNLAPMPWETAVGAGEKIAPAGGTTWLPGLKDSFKTSLTEVVRDMAKLRSQTTPMYVNAIYKDNQASANCEIRYTADELIVVERWYPRRNSYVLVANLGKETRTRDLSSLYYGGHVVVGPPETMNQNVYFKGLTIVPGEAFVIKLDK